MALRESFLLGLATTLLVALTEQSAIAFTITPPQPGANGNYNPLAPYNLSNGTGETFLDTYLCNRSGGCACGAPPISKVVKYLGENGY